MADDKQIGWLDLIKTPVAACRTIGYVAGLVAVYWPMGNGTRTIVGTISAISVASHHYLASLAQPKSAETADATPEEKS